ncbi:MAG: transcriptional regulator [Caldilinea sp. CFX5]|nr:transcriptional regulator [Caldilinea sp. CFX5]
MQPLSEPILVRPVCSEADYEAALAEIEQMMGKIKPDTPDGNKFDLLVTLIEAYEDQHYPMGETSDPISMIEFIMDQQGLTRKDLEPYIGPRQRVWEIMERRRRLTLPMIRRLEVGLKIPAELLIREYELMEAVV